MTTNTSTDLPATLPTTWCRMWNDDASLAHELMTDDARQWSGNAPNLDPLVGPAPAEAFVAAWRAEAGLRFTPRLVVADGSDRLAYTWDVAAPDGSVRTGIDVNVLRGDRVSENWTLVGERRAGPDPAAAGGMAGSGTASRAEIAALCSVWTAVWNGATDRVTDVLAHDFGIWFGGADAGADDLRGPDAFAAYVERHRAGRPSLRFALHREPVVDADRQRAAFTWTAEVETDAGRREVGGIDVVAVHGGRIGRVWSITGSRPFAF